MINPLWGRVLYWLGLALALVFVIATGAILLGVRFARQGDSQIEYLIALVPFLLPLLGLGGIAFILIVISGKRR